MDLQELLDEHGLDSAGVERTLEWALGRADELVSELDEGSELRELLGEAPAKHRSQRLAREDLPPVPSAVPTATKEDDDSVDIPIDDPGASATEIAIDDGDIEMLDDEDLEEIVEEAEDEGEPEGGGVEPDLLALAVESEDSGVLSKDLPPDKDPAVDALLASLDDDDD